MKYLVTGAQGQVGHELCKQLAPAGEVVAISRRETDLSDPEAVAAMLARHRPEVVVNAAAYTAVDRAEEEPESARRLNAELPAQLARWCAGEGALLVHYSTDYVYDGSGSEPFDERRPVRPLSVYGRTKLAGDEAVAEAGARHLIFRTAWVYGARGSNFLRTMLRLTHRGKHLTVVDDQWGAPTPGWLIAGVTARALAEHARGKGPQGVYHLTCRGETSWCGFARAIVNEAADWEHFEGRAEQIAPIDTDGYPTPAPRPKNSRLSVDRLEAALGLSLPDWRTALALTMVDGKEGALK